MQPIVFKIALFRGDFDQARSQYSLLWLMEALCRINQSHIRQMRRLVQEKKVPAPYPLLYRSGVHYEPEPGTEEWLDVPTILGVHGGTFPGAWGDCVPVTTLVMREGWKLTPIGLLRVGDRIMGSSDWTRVRAHALTGRKAIMEVGLDNGSTLRASPDHRIFLADGSEIRMQDAFIGMRLLYRDGEDMLAKCWNARTLVRRRQAVLFYATAEYVRQGGETECADITTDEGLFWLPETGVVVHNCEDLACWRVAELREGGPGVAPVKAKPFAKWRRKDDGSYAYHALSLLPDGRLEDPSLVLGMGNEPEFARLRMAERYKEGSLTPSVRYAKIPDVVVVDPSKRSGFSKDVHGAKQRTGLHPPPGAPVTGIVKGRIPVRPEPNPMFPDAAMPATSDEDGSIYASIQGVGGDMFEPAAWGFDVGDVDHRHMRELMAMASRRPRVRVTRAGLRFISG
jgi:hypothetical protein